MATDGGDSAGPERLVADLYEAALEPSLWRSALDRMGDALGGTASVFGLHRPAGLAFGATNRLDPDRQARLVEHYVRPDTNPLFGAMPRLPVLQPVPRERIMSDESYARSGLYNDVFRPQGLTHVSVACLAREGGILISCGLLRRTNREFTAEHGRLYNLILPHLRRTVELTVRTLDLAAASGHAAHLADVAPVGLVVVDAAGLVLYANLRAARILDAGDGLACRGGRISTGPGTDRRQLQKLIEDAALRRGQQGGSMCVARAHGAAPWAVIVMPVPSAAARLAENKTAAALLRVVDLEARPEAPARRLAELFGLSATEARLAAELMGGARPEDIAERRGVKISTVRSQLHAVFAKTGTTRQSELVSLLALVAGPPGD